MSRTRTAILGLHKDTYLWSPKNSLYVAIIARPFVCLFDCPAREMDSCIICRQWAENIFDVLDSRCSTTMHTNYPDTFVSDDLLLLHT